MYETTWFGLATIHILTNYISAFTCNDIKANWINCKRDLIYNQSIVSMWNVVMQCNIVCFSGLMQWKSSFYTFCLAPPSEVKSCMLNPSERVTALWIVIEWRSGDLEEKAEEIACQLPADSIRHLSQFQPKPSVIPDAFGPTYPTCCR